MPISQYSDFLWCTSWTIRDQYLSTVRTNSDYVRRAFPPNYKFINGQLTINFYVHPSAHNWYLDPTATADYSCMDIGEQLIEPGLTDPEGQMASFKHCVKQFCLLLCNPFPLLWDSLGLNMSDYINVSKLAALFEVTEDVKEALMLCSRLVFTEDDPYSLIEIAWYLDNRPVFQQLVDTSI